MRVRRLTLCLAALGALLTATAGSAAADTGPVLRVDALANTSVAPGGQLDYFIQVSNMGSAATTGEPIVLEAELPPGFTALGYANEPTSEFVCTAGDGSALAGAGSVKCTSSQVLTGPETSERSAAFTVTVQVAPEADGIATTTLTVSGGGAAGASSGRAVEVTPAAPAFGIAGFDQRAFADSAGTESTEAGAHPFDLATYVEFNTQTHPGNPVFRSAYPVEPAKDALADLPPGLIGIPTSAETCTQEELANAHLVESRPLCPSASQVGVIYLRLVGSGGGFASTLWGPFPLFNMVPGLGQPALFGFSFEGSVITITARLRSNGDYGITAGGVDIPEALALAGTEVHFWGDPAAAEHDVERGCPDRPAPGQGGPHCSGAAEPSAFLRNATSCSGPAATTLHLDSWFHPGGLDAEGRPLAGDPNWKTATVVSHGAPGYPFSPADPGTPWGAPAGLEGCDQVPFSPEVEISPTTDRADSPTGLHFRLTMPQQGLRDPAAVAESDLRAAVVDLPEGMSVNPSAASGLDACSSSQVGLRTPVGAKPIRFDEAPVQCPDSAKIGEARIETPLLDHPLEGNVYLAKQADNPFGSLLALYLTFADRRSGVVVKLAGEIGADPGSGRLETSFEENPQLPFDDLEVDLFGGPRATLRTPSACGTYTIAATLTPWSGTAPVRRQSPFTIGSCSGGFSPKFEAGTTQPLAGAFSPFTLRVSRNDGEDQLGSIATTLPEGLLAKLAGVPYCSDSALAAISGEEGAGAREVGAPACPAASRLGSVVAASGPGPNPFFATKGSAYLAGPYKGAPLSLAAVVPALAGPFDLGTVAVRSGIRVDPQSARVSVASDPLPQILHGIPLDLREIRVLLDRSEFIRNPTSCDEMQVAATIASTGGATAAPTQRFQVSGCSRLGFKPALALRLSGRTRRSGHPALRATLTMPQGSAQANVARAAVSLPHSEFLAQSHIRTVCTRVQYDAGGGGGAGCPPGSVYGHARAFSPLLDSPLEGPVYLRSNGGERRLPDLVASLSGQIHVDLVGFVDSDPRTRGLRTRFAAVPDAPVSKFVLTMPGGSRGLLENSTDVCRGSHRAIVRLDGQNGMIRDFRPLVGARCGTSARQR